MKLLGERLNGRSVESRVTRMVTSNDGVILSSDELCAWVGLLEYGIL